MNELATLVNVFNKTFQGPAWYGRSIVKTLESIPESKLLLRVNNSYNVVELVYHMLAWRQYVSHVLQYDTLLEVTPAINFPKVQSINWEDWMELIKTLRKSQHALVALMSAFSKDLDGKGPLEQSTYRDIIYGIVHHDIYHIGQINFLIKYA